MKFWREGGGLLRRRHDGCYETFSCSGTLRVPSAAGRGPVPVLVDVVTGLACVPVEWHGLESVCVS